MERKWNKTKQNEFYHEFYERAASQCGIVKYYAVPKQVSLSTKQMIRR